MGLFKDNHERQAVSGKCSCGGGGIDWGFTIVELLPDGSPGPRTTTVHLCRACGNVAFDMLASAGFLSKAEFKPFGPPEIAAKKEEETIRITADEFSMLRRCPVLVSSLLKGRRRCLLVAGHTGPHEPSSHRWSGAVLHGRAVDQ